jgi:hypothetical protein
MSAHSTADVAQLQTLLKNSPDDRALTVAARNRTILSDPRPSGSGFQPFQQRLQPVLFLLYCFSNTIF